MEKSNEVSWVPDSSRTNESSLEDDTEDYIQPSQPLSFQNSSLETDSRKVDDDEELMGIGISAINDSMSCPNSLTSTPAEDTSSDFIPQSEAAPKRKMESKRLSSNDPHRKRLNLDESSIINGTPDMFATQYELNDTVDAAQPKVPESPFVTGSRSDLMVPESPMCVNETLENESSDVIFSENKHRVLNETATSECVNASAELDGSTSQKSDSFVKNVGLSVDRTSGPRETMMDLPQGILDRSGLPSFIHTDNIVEIVSDKKADSQETALDDTIDVDELENCNSFSSDKADLKAASTKKVISEGLTSIDQDSESSLVGGKLDKKGPRLKYISQEEIARLQKHSTPENPQSKSLNINESTSSIENGTPPVQEEFAKSEINITVHLQVNCHIVMDLIKNEATQKKILNVKELVKRQPKQILEPYSDSSSKVKRLSSSSYGSVYSDKTGLPYTLPDRPSPATLITENSSSSSVDLEKHMRITNRQVWQNEYMLMLALDDIIPRCIEEQKKDLERNDGNAVVKRKPSCRLKKKSHWSHPLDNVLESSLTEVSSGNNSDVHLRSVHKPEGFISTEVPAEEKCSPPKNLKEEEHVEKKETEKETIVEKDSTPQNEGEEVEEAVDPLTEGSLVFARWTDKRYYPGKLKCKAKYDRWEVEFDDDTEKVIREDLIIPLNWLTKGELVFALVADKYLSGKIADIIREDEVKFRIELDDSNDEVTVRKCDICLNDVMAGIIREKFNPTTKPVMALKSSAIDFDNVVVGKRVREQRTPIRTTSVIQPGSSTSKKRRAPRSEEESIEKKTPRAKQTPLRKRDVLEKTSTKKPSKSEGQAVNRELQATNACQQTPTRLVASSDGKSGLKRSRASGKPSTSSKKSKQSSGSKGNSSPKPANRRKTKSSVKSLATRFESEVSNMEKEEKDGSAESVDNQNTTSKATRSQKMKSTQVKDPPPPTERKVRRGRKGKKEIS